MSNRQTKRFEKEVTINNQNLTAYFDVDGVLSESSFSHGLGVQTDRVVTCDPHEDLMVFDSEGYEVTNQDVISEVNNVIDSQDYVEEFDF